MKNLAIEDYHDIFNSLGATQPPIVPVDSKVSFDVHWQTVDAGFTHIRDTANHFVGDFAHTTATISWSALQRSTNFAFTSDAASTSNTISGVIGREANGTFFS